jgi:hypothetical protein
MHVRVLATPFALWFVLWLLVAQTLHGGEHGGTKVTT